MNASVNANAPVTDDKWLQLEFKNRGVNGVDGLLVVWLVEG